MRSSVFVIAPVARQCDKAAYGDRSNPRPPDDSAASLAKRKKESRNGVTMVSWQRRTEQNFHSPFIWSFVLLSTVSAWRWGTHQIQHQTENVESKHDVHRSLELSLKASTRDATLDVSRVLTGTNLVTRPRPTYFAYRRVYLIWKGPIIYILSALFFENLLVMLQIS